MEGTLLMEGNNMDKIEENAPSVEKLIEYTVINAYESGHKEWAHGLERVYKGDNVALDYAFIEVFREWALKNNLL